MNFLTFRYAIQSDTPALFSLINSAYRGDSARGGWTHEADLVGGLRTTMDELSETFGSYLLVLSGGVISGCVHLTEQKNCLFVGMLAISPEKQNQKLGSSLLSEIDRIARAKGKKFVKLSVIHVRAELISYYERKGFTLTGGSEEFPSQYPAKIPGLLLLEMQKTL